MASSGYFNTSAYSGRYLQFLWSTQSRNTANNTTTIAWTLKGAGNATEWYNSGNFRVVIAGETVFSSADRIRLENGTVVATGTYTLKHNADGSRSFTASVQAGIYTVAVNCSGSGTFELDSIARASQPSCITWPEHTQNVGFFGDTISIHMNRNSASYTHTVRYAFGSRTGTIAENVGTGTTWTIPLSFMELLPADTAGSGTIYVDTYSGSTKIGTKWCGFTAKVPTNVKPKCSIQVLDNTEIQELYGNLVQGLSKLYVKTTGTQSYKSPIKSYSVVANGVRYSAAEIVTGVLTQSGTTKVTATVTDQRGRTSDAVSASFTVLAYAAPNVTKLSAVRCNEDGTANKRGAFVKVTFSAAISALNNKNNALYYLKYKKSSESTYTKVSLTELTNKYSVSNYSYIFPANTGNSYDIAVEAVDRHNSTNPASKSTKAPTATSIFSWRGFKTSSGIEDGVGIGKVPEKANTLQVGWNAEFDQDLVQIGNRYSFQPDAFSGEKGYTLLAEITLNTLNVNAPIVFTINRRGAASPMKLYIRFASSSTSTDPDIGSFKYEGTNYGAFLIKAATSTWRLYVDNTSGWSNPCVQEWYTTDNQHSRLSVSFPKEQIATLPTPWYRAGPLAPQNIMDSFFPVGYILLLYSHADPNTMYPGTEWVRIYGAFPWFTDEKGEIGLTGGERTVTLTEKQIPSHNHGGTYTNAGTARTHAWLTSNGSAMGYDTVNAGGGEAHNNMPPYIQISAWRRTA